MRVPLRCDGHHKKDDCVSALLKRASALFRHMSSGDGAMSESGHERRIGPFRNRSALPPWHRHTLRSSGSMKKPKVRCRRFSPRLLPWFCSSR